MVTLMTVDAVEHVRVVVVSPGDVARERAAAQTVIDELNRTIAGPHGIRLSLWRWEADARPGLHGQGPQGLVDDLMDIHEADLVIGVFWKRFGTPTDEADSGTEHELRRAWAAWKERRRPEVMIYMCARAYAPRSPDELVQWQRVLEFQRELPKQQLWWEYTRVHRFEALLREHLTRFVLERSAARDVRPIATASAARVRFNLPTVAASFAGRKSELDALDAALGVADRVVITQAITGLGGVGKSQLAARYVHERTDRYDIVAWIRAQDGGIAELAELAAKLGQPGEGLSPSERAQFALDRLSESRRPWLLVLDNVESAEQLDGLRPRSGSGRVLVTSRDRALRQFGPVLAVDVLDEATATAYLTKRAGRPDDADAARELAAALGHLPLALSHAAAYCESGTTFADYLALLGELPARELFDSKPELSYAQTIASTWKASMDAACSSAPLAVDVLEIAAHLGPDAIPKSLFEGLVVREAASGRKRLADAFNALARFSLAVVDDTSISVHRLLQKTIRDDVAEDRPAALHALRAVGQAFPADRSLPAQWPLCEQLLPHVLALADAPTQPGEAAASVVELLNHACDYLNWAEPGGRGLPLARTTLLRAERVLDAGHPERLRARSRLSSALRHAGEHDEAIRIGEALVADSAEILGTEHPETLAARHGLAYALRDAGRVGEAIAIYEPLLADRERILGATHAATLMTRNNLAYAYHDSGRFALAITIHEGVLANRERLLGREHPSTLTTRNNLARSLQAAGRTDAAITILEPLLADRKRILGAEHPATLTTLKHLATAYVCAGRTGEAIAVFESLVADRERILGTDHPDTVAARDDLSAARGAGSGAPG